MTLSAYCTNSEHETEIFASLFVKHLYGISMPIKFLINGHLGSGKTCFVRGLIQGFYPETVVGSATYVFANSFGTNPIIHHLDLYRISNHDLEDLGILEIINDHNSIICIEWPIFWIKSHTKTIRIQFSYIKNKNGRLIKLFFSDDFPENWVLTLKQDLFIFNVNNEDRGVEQSGSSSGS